MSGDALRVTLLVLAFFAGGASAQERYEPEVQPASDEGEAALAAMEVADGLTVSLWAAEPLLANPVCLTIDPYGAIYVGETFRHGAGVADVRDHMDWLDDDLACRTVADRIAMLKKHLGDDFGTFEEEHDRVRKLVDRDGDGRADVATTYADGFNAPEAGIGAGLLYNAGDVYYTCIPDLWRLRDETGNGEADVRDLLSTGYGAKVAFLGHDMHGLRVGMDGRLWFSIGDRGFHVETPDGVVAEWESGAVLRCELDGSDLEIFATGLRNPQELAFDAFGNLFTGDNNGDGGDEARFVYVMEGSDSGWRQPYQWLSNRGPWNAEHLWHPAHEGQAAYILPPLANLADGPSGLTANPGAGLGPAWQSYFFLCDFLGAASMSGVAAFTLAPQGAGFEVSEVEQLLWGLEATDCEFGPDGALYVTDWVEGWSKNGKGRVYRVSDPENERSTFVRDTQAILQMGMTGHGLQRLSALLGYPDQRVRLAAQLELVARGPDGHQQLLNAAWAGSGLVRDRSARRPSSSPDSGQGPFGSWDAAAQGKEHQDLMRRLHGIWGLGVAARTSPGVLDVILELTDDPDPRVRAQVVRVLGDVRVQDAKLQIIERLADTDPYVQSLAAIAAGRLGAPEAVTPLVAVLRAAIAREDPYLRHAAMMGLLACAPAARFDFIEALGATADERVAATVVLRRRADPRLADYLTDASPLVVAEAARAVHDLPVDAALPALADLLGATPPEEDVVLVRAMNAAFRLGGERRARALARLALDPTVDDAHRVEALDMLAHWTAPSPRDRVTGSWRPLPERAGPYLEPIALGLLERGVDAEPEDVVLAWIDLLAAVETRGADARLSAWVEDRKAPGPVRVAALETLALDAQEPLIPGALADPDPALRAAALSALVELDPAQAMPRIPGLLAAGSLPEQRAALVVLGKVADPAADDLLAGELRQLLAGLVPDEVALDVLLAAEARATPEINNLLGRVRAQRLADPLLAPWFDGLIGGDAEAGREVFERPALSCQRCHGRGADDSQGVGPSLHGVGARLARLQLLESIVDPNRRTSPGFGATRLVLADGGIVSGRILEEADGVVSLIDSNGDVTEYAVDTITERLPALSAMPEEMGVGITRTEMRDLLEYLAEL